MHWDTSGKNSITGRIGVQVSYTWVLLIDAKKQGFQSQYRYQ